jgi:DNA-binding NtrC family response regulator
MAAEETRTVLLVDDEAVYLAAMAKVLGRHGLDVLTSDSGEGALKILRESGAEVVVLGITNAPEASLAALRAIRREKPRTPVIVLVNQESVDAGVEALKLGAFDLQPKPVPVANLLETIEEADRSRRLAERAAKEKG